MTAYTELQARLIAKPKSSLVTGGAGFIGSNLLETLLTLNQNVVGLDNFSTGYLHNLDEVQSMVSPVQWANFRFIKETLICSPAPLPFEGGRRDNSSSDV